jgi:hypothetical protein
MLMGGGARSNLATVLVGQRDDNAITGATNELKRVLILAGDFVHVMRKPSNDVNSVIAFLDEIQMRFGLRHTFFAASGGSE